MMASLKGLGIIIFVTLGLILGFALAHWIIWPLFEMIINYSPVLAAIILVIAVGLYLVYGFGRERSRISGQ